MKFVHVTKPENWTDAKKDEVDDEKSVAFLAYKDVPTIYTRGIEYGGQSLTVDSSAASFVDKNGTTQTLTIEDGQIKFAQYNAITATSKGGGTYEYDETPSDWSVSATFSKAGTTTTAWSNTSDGLASGSAVAANTKISATASGTVNNTFSTSVTVKEDDGTKTATAKSTFTWSKMKIGYFVSSNDSISITGYTTGGFSTNVSEMQTINAQEKPESQYISVDGGGKYIYICIPADGTGNDNWEVKGWYTNELMTISAAMVSDPVTTFTTYSNGKKYNVYRTKETQAGSVDIYIKF